MEAKRMLLMLLASLSAACAHQAGEGAEEIDKSVNITRRVHTDSPAHVMVTPMTEIPPVSDIKTLAVKLCRRYPNERKLRQLDVGDELCTALARLPEGHVAGNFITNPNPNVRQPNCTIPDKLWDPIRKEIISSWNPATGTGMEGDAHGHIDRDDFPSYGDFVTAYDMADQFKTVHYFRVMCTTGGDAFLYTLPSGLIEKNLASSKDDDWTDVGTAKVTKIDEAHMRLDIHLKRR
jgi:hypothetical protein